VYNIYTGNMQNELIKKLSVKQVLASNYFKLSSK
jgi:hypothetical protein